MQIELKYKTPIEWAHNVVENIDEFLQDHADAERKVSNMCMSFIAKYPNRKAMLDMTIDPGYQKIHIHRDAGLEGQLNIETLDNLL